MSDNPEYGIRNDNNSPSIDLPVERIQSDLFYLLSHYKRSGGFSEDYKVVKIYEAAAEGLSKIAGKVPAWSWNYVSIVYRDETGKKSSKVMKLAIVGLAEKIRAQVAREKRNREHDFRLRPVQVLSSGKVYNDYLNMTTTLQRGENIEIWMWDKQKNR